MTNKAKQHNKHKHNTKLEGTKAARENTKQAKKQQKQATLGWSSAESELAELRATGARPQQRQHEKARQTKHSNTTSTNTTHN